MSGARAPDESALCTQCGLCCAGPLYHFGLVDDAEAARMKDLGARIWPGPEQAMALPCTLLDGTRCSVYDQRPGFCSAYRCELLNRHAEGVVDQPAAEAIIAKARALTEAVTAQLPAGETIATMRKRWSINPEFWRDAPAAEQGGLLRLVMALAALNLHLDRHFRYPDQQVIR